MTETAGVHRKGSIKLSSILKNTRTRKNFADAGAIGLFIGVVRGKSSKKDEVLRLELEAYEEQADQILNGICKELKKKEGIVDVQIHHLLGEFGVGEALVYVLVAGSHRDEMFSTLKKAVQRYKREVPIFKKEYIAKENGQLESYWENE
ncbi:MAG: molybdenum cofactor biosynthesis protein MoaE [Candidatus Bathyarchaeota archaeon]|nr:molybdenum cofactor biosynthesis protein MoaE [Candidatus Bathyarchaeota archaeon]